MTAKQPPEELDRLQRWMLAVITHTGGIFGGMASAEAQREISVSPGELEQIIERSRSQTSVERLQVYANAYYARLIECLREEFPALVYVLGEETFNGFALEYLQVYPPRSYTLAMLGAHFPQFMRETRPAEETDGAANWADFLIDLATLERTYSEVFDGPGMEGQRRLESHDLLAISAERWSKTKLVPVDCLRLLELQYPVHEFASAVKRGHAPAIPEPSPTFLVIHREDYVVRRRAALRMEFAVLKALCEEHTVGEAILLLAEDPDMDMSDLAAKLRAWFQQWSATGLFRKIDQPI